MKKLLNKIALFVSVVTFVICAINGISLFTCIVRSAEVLIGILFMFFIASNLLRMGVVLMAKRPEVQNK